MAHAAKLAAIVLLVIAYLAMIGLDIAAAVKAYRAEAAQEKVKKLKVLFLECKLKPNPEAYELGIAAKWLLSFAHIVPNVHAVCLLCWYCISSSNKASSFRKQIATACFVISWVAFVVGFWLLGKGAHQNQKERPTCDFTLTNNLLRDGSIACVAHGAFATAFCIFGIAFCVSATEGGRESKSSTP